MDDPAVLNHFETQGRLRPDVENLDIHISCPVPDDPEVARKSIFYIDDVSLQAIEEPPLAVSTPLDEYYEGEIIPWTVNTTSINGEIQIALFMGNRLVGEQTRSAASGPLHGTFESHRLKPGIYALQARTIASSQAPQAAQRQIILAPNPWKE